MEQRKSVLGSQAPWQQRGGSQTQKEHRAVEQKSVTAGSGLRMGFPLVDYDSDSDEQTGSDPGSPQNTHLSSEENGSSSVRSSGEHKSSAAGPPRVNTGTSAQAKVPGSEGVTAANASQGPKNLSGSRNESSRGLGKETSGGGQAPHSMQKMPQAVISRSEPASQKAPTATLVNVATGQAASKTVAVAVTAAPKTPQASAPKILGNTSSVSSNVGLAIVSTKVVSSSSAVSTAHIPPKSVSTSAKSTPSTTLKIVSGSSKLASPAPSRPGAPSAIRPVASTATRPETPALARSGTLTARSGAPSSTRSGALSSTLLGAQSPTRAGAPAPTRSGAPVPVGSGTPPTRQGTPTKLGTPVPARAEASSPTRSGAPSSTRPAVSSSTGLGTPSLLRPRGPSPTRPGAPLSARSGAPASTRPGVPTSTEPGTPTLSRPGTPTSKPGTPASTRPGTPAVTRPGAATPTRSGASIATRPGAPTSTRPGTQTAARPGASVSTRGGALAAARSGALPVGPGAPKGPGAHPAQLGISVSKSEPVSTPTKSVGAATLGTSTSTTSKPEPGVPVSPSSPSNSAVTASLGTGADPAKLGEIPLPAKPVIAQPLKSAASAPAKPALTTTTKPAATTPTKSATAKQQIIVKSTNSGAEKTVALPPGKPTTTVVSPSKPGEVPVPSSKHTAAAVSSEPSHIAPSKPAAMSSPYPSVPASKSVAETNPRLETLKKQGTAQSSETISVTAASPSTPGVVAPTLPSKRRVAQPPPSKRGVAAPPSSESGAANSGVSAPHSKPGTPATLLTTKGFTEIISSDGSLAQGKVSFDTKTNISSIIPESLQNVSAIVDEKSGATTNKSRGFPSTLTGTVKAADVTGKGTASEQPAKIFREKLSQNPCPSSVRVNKPSSQSLLDHSSLSSSDLSSETVSLLEASIEAELARLDGGEDYKTDKGLSHLIAGQLDKKIKSSSEASQAGHMKKKQSPCQADSSKGAVISTSVVKDMTPNNDIVGAEKTNMVKAAFADMRAKEKKEQEESAEANKTLLKNEEENIDFKKGQGGNSDADETDNITSNEEQGLIKCKSLPTDMTAIREFMQQETVKVGSILKEGSDDNEDEPAIKKARMEIQANMSESAAPSYSSAISSNMSSAMSSACVTTDNTPENSNLTSASDETRDIKDLDKMIEAEEGKDEDGKKDGMDDDGGEDEKDKPDDLSQATPKRKRKRRYYERPRGEGGKFMKSSEPVVMDEDTRMDANTNSISMTRPIPPDEDSRGSTGNSSSKREVRRFRCEVVVPRSTETFTADRLYEYTWPLEGLGEHYFIQEHISAFLGIMSFKRRYPDLRRRAIDMHERDYLREKQVVSEMDCDLGLTAVRSEDVLDVLYNDFPSKFEELQRILRERSENQLKERGKVAYQMANIDKSKLQEHVRKAACAAARWNANLNKERKEERRYSFDLQSFTLQKPVGRGKKLPPEYTKMGHYPVSVLPGQYTDFYKIYTPNEMKYLPLNTVLFGPRTKDQLGSDGAPSDSEDESSDILTAKVEKGDVDSDEGSPHCKVCSGTRKRNKESKPEPLIICAQCSSASHPTCIDLTLNMVTKIQGYDWQCMDCKTCVQCNDPDDEEKMIFCDMCDRGYHIYCVGLRRVPQGRWHCKVCAVCSSCGSKTPAGSENIKNADWQHEFKKDKDNRQLVYAATLCMPCDKYWKRRQFCNICLRVYRSIPEDGMVRCSSCPKYIHKEGCSVIHENERFCNNCFKMRNNTAMNHSRIIAAAKKKMASGY